MLNLNNKIMKNLCLLILVMVFISFMNSCSKEEINNEETLKTDTSVVSVYFAYSKMTSDINPASKLPLSKKKSVRLLNNENSNWPDFFSNPLNHLFSDSCALSVISQTLENGDYEYSEDCGEVFMECPQINYSKKGTATIIEYNMDNLIAPIVNSYSFIIDEQFYYASTNKCFSLIGNAKFSVTGGTNADFLRDIDIKIGECDNEITYKETQTRNYSDTLMTIQEGSSQHAGKIATYNTTILKPLVKGTNFVQYIISGRAKVAYNKDGKEGEFTIDYGDGSPDSKATITENGKSYEVDYITLQEEMYNSLINKK